MIVIRTPERAERFARMMEGMRMRVDRVDPGGQVISSVDHGDIIVSTRLYARVWRKGGIVMMITYETIDQGSMLL